MARTTPLPRLAWLILTLISLPLWSASAGAASAVTQLLRHEAAKGVEIGADKPAPYKRPMAKECRLLAETTTNITQKRADVLADMIAEKLKEKDGMMLWARADAARRGLFGLPRSASQALAFYIQAATTDHGPRPEAGYNAALMLYKKTQGRPSAKVAKRILSLLSVSDLLKLDETGEEAGQAHYIAATIYEHGYLGNQDPTRAFLHYRASAESRFLPGVYNYLLQLSQAMLEMTPKERENYGKELRMMVKRYRWQSLELLQLIAAVYRAGLIADPEDFRGPYYSLVLANWQGTDDPVVKPSSNPDSASAQRIADAAARVMRTVPKPPPMPEPAYAELCAPED